MSRISDYMYRWRETTPVIQDGGATWHYVEYASIYPKGPIEEELAADEACRGRERKPLERSVEQRMEAIESSVDHLSQQMKLIVNSMVIEHKLGDYE